MKETGIIMSGNHPKLIIDCQKTQTRRTQGLENINEIPDDWCFIEEDNIWQFINKTGSIINIKCPYGQVGDRLWVRETWRPAWAVNPGGISGPGIQYKSDMVKLGRVEAKQYAECQFPNAKWRSSRFMPRWASRLTLVITGLRAERLQEISREDIRAEGIGLPVSPRFTPDALSELHQEFQSLWDSLNAKRGYGWESNPWVWVIEFNAIGIRSK